MALETPLLNEVSCTELNHVNVGNITANNVNMNHQLVMEKGLSIDADLLVSILGGPDAILQHYLSSENGSQLTTDQLHQINDALTSRTSSHDNRNMQSPVLKVSEENTFLHKICHPKIGNKLVNIIFNRWIISIVCFMSFSTFLMWVLFAADILQLSDISFIVWSVISYSAMFVFSFLLLLALNKTTTKLILCTFEFNLKIFYFIRYWICAAIYVGHQTPEITVLYWFITFTTFLAALIFCLLDGLKIPFKAKAILLTVGSILFSLATFYWTFLWTKPYFVNVSLWSNHSMELDMRE